MRHALRLGLVAVHLVIFAAGAFAQSPPAPPPPPTRSLESLLEDVRASLAVDQAYVPGTESEFTLEPNQAARLKFAANDAGVTEVLFRYEPEGLQILYGYVSDPHCWTSATPKRPVEWRITASEGSKAWMHCTNKFQEQDGKARVRFFAKPMTSGEVSAFMKRERERELQELRKRLEWDETDTAERIEMNIPGPEDPDLIQLRTKHDLEKLVAGASDDYDKLRRVLKWVHDRWSHNGDNTPSQSDPLTILAEAAQGKRFRCVEYSIVTAGCAQALGMPARVVGLKRKDVETAESGAGHVVAEVWLASLKKWVFADGQMDAIPEKNGMPLSAVEFQEAFAKNEPGLKIRSSSKVDAANYLAWVVPYLYYFDFNRDQRLFGLDSDYASDDRRSEPKNGKVMLVPKGAKQPTVFQRKTPIKNCTYISSPKSFYAPPASTGKASAQSLPARPSAEQIRAKVTQRIPCRFEAEAQFTVAEGQAVALQCPENPHGLEEFVIYPDGHDLIWYSYCDEVTGKHYRKDGRDRKGSLEQIGYTPCVAIIEWTIQGRELKISFCLTTDKGKIARAMERVARERGQWSARTHANILPPVNIPEAERIAGFVRLWSEVKYNFAFFDKHPDLDWDKVLDEYLPRVQQATTAPEYYKVLRQCMALLHDGHTEVWGPSDDPSASLPVAVGPVGGKAIIVAIMPTDQIKNAARREEYARADLKVGDEITAIDGQAVGQVLREKLYPYICASTPQGLDLKAYPKLLRGEHGSKVRLGVRSLDGGEREVTLTRGEYSVRRPVVSRPDGELGDGAFYVELGSFDDDKVVRRFKEHLPKIRQAHGLILDVRNNGGGSTSNGAAIISYLTDKTLPGSHWKTRMYRPAFRAWGQPETWHEGEHTPVKPSKDPYLGPVVVLTGPQTFSAAEDFLVVLKASGRAKLVGERSGGSTGQPLMIKNLPAGGGARICTKRDTFPDGTDFVGVGVVPDVEVHPTAADIAAGRDRVLEEGLATIKKMISRE